MGVVGLSQLTPVHAADTTAKSVGTLEIKDGTQTLTSVDSLNFGDVAYNANGMTKDLKGTTEKATVEDTTFSQTAWTISGQTDSDVAELTINGHYCQQHLKPSSLKLLMQNSANKLQQSKMQTCH